MKISTFVFMHYVIVVSESGHADAVAWYTRFRDMTLRNFASTTHKSSFDILSLRWNAFRAMSKINEAMIVISIYQKQNVIYNLLLHNIYIINGKNLSGCL